MSQTARQATERAVEEMRDKLVSPKIVCESEYTALHELIESILDSSLIDDDLAHRASTMFPGMPIEEAARTALRNQLASVLQGVIENTVHVARTLDVELDVA